MKKSNVLLLIILLLVLAAISKGVMDKVDFHYDNSVFTHSMFNEQWWNPELSWQNHYKNGNPEEGLAFPLADSLLIYFTDAWHFFSLIRETCWGAACVLFGFLGFRRKWWWAELLTILSVYGLTFYLYFHYILEM